MIKELYTIPITIMFGFINICLLYDSIELNEDYAIQYIIPIIVGICFGALTYIAIGMVKTRLWFVCLFILLGFGVILYLNPFKYLIYVYFLIQTGLLGVVLSTNITTNNITNIPLIISEPEEPKETIKEQIIKHHKAGLKQGQIADKVGKSQGYISQVLKYNKK